MSRNRPLALAVTASAVHRVLQVASTLVIIPLALHALGASGFGLWGAATSLAFLAPMLDLGLGAALISQVARAWADGDRRLASDLVGTGLMGTVAMAMLVLAGGSLLVSLSTAGPERAVFMLAVAGLALNVPFSTANNIWIGLQKGYVAGCWDMVQTLLSAGGLLWAALSGAGVIVLVAAFYGGIVVASALSLTHLLLAHPELRPARLRVPAAIWRAVLGKGGLFFLITALGVLAYSLDNVLALVILGPVASAQMAIALRIGVNAIGIIASLTQPLWPAFVDAHAKGDDAWTRATLLRGTAIVTGITATGAIILVTVGEPLLRLWLGKDLGLGGPLLGATAFWVFALAVPRVAALMLNALSILRLQVLALGAATGLGLALKYAFAGYFGVTGILVTTPVCWLLIVWPAFAWRLVRWRQASRSMAGAPTE